MGNKKKGLIIATILIIAIIVVITLVILLSNKKSNNNNPVVSAKDVADDTNTYYGQLVENYNVEGANAWRIFYADDNNIYLIADDFVSSKYIPNSANNSINVNNTEYSVTFMKVQYDYENINSIDKEFANKWLSEYVKSGNDKSESGIKSVAYLLDKNIWKTFANNYAEYAIGAPTIEMFCASYKDTHPDKYIEYIVEDDGYKIKWSDEEKYTIAHVAGLIEDEYNSIYTKTNHSKAYSTWIASPSTSPARLMESAYGGIVSAYKFYLEDNTGIRPIVCLKSDVQLEKQENGNYKIK